MNRFNRLITLPLAFALFATAMVAAVGEPVQRPDGAPLDPLPVISDAEPAPALMPVSDESEPAELDQAAATRGAQAARLRWVITLPHARNSCCRRPI